MEKVNTELRDKWRENKEVEESIAVLKNELESYINKNSELEQLKHQDSLEKKSNGDLFMGKYDQQRICGEIKELLSENEDLKTFATDLKSELEYGKQRENKLMYFLFLLQQKDYPVFDIFETYIKDLQTHRFSTELDEDYKNIYIDQMRKLKTLGLLERGWHKSERKKCKNKLGESDNEDSIF
jgi:hypothetical protein